MILQKHARSKCEMRPYERSGLLHYVAKLWLTCLYKSDYVVVADPPGFHLLPEDQKVVVILAEQFLSKQTIGNAYVKLPFEFTLDDGRQVFIYQKERKFNSEELLKISRMFTEYYPNNKEKFEISSEMIKELSKN